MAGLLIPPPFLSELVIHHDKLISLVDVHYIQTLLWSKKKCEYNLSIFKFLMFCVLSVDFNKKLFFCFSDISKPPRTPTKKNHLTEDREIPSPDGGLSNPAFSDGEQDLSLIEEGWYI